MLYLLSNAELELYFFNLFYLVCLEFTLDFSDIDLLDIESSDKDLYLLDIDKIPSQ